MVNATFHDILVVKSGPHNSTIIYDREYPGP